MSYEKLMNPERSAMTVKPAKVIYVNQKSYLQEQLNAIDLAVQEMQLNRQSADIDNGRPSHYFGSFQNDKTA
jgi:hypothetical protein